MIGYIQNITSGWAHAMKRAIRPGGKIELDELYIQYGKKHAIEEGAPFIEWLKSIKLRDPNRWKIVYDDGTRVTPEVAVEVNNTVEGAAKNEESKVSSRKTDHVTPIVPKGISVSDLVGLPVRKARDMMPQLTDVKLLQYALQQASSLSNKDSLCRILRKRITELKIAR
ncbi:MAG TPA: hypothetical protein VI911_08085 [Patescibacteria group bacterium]|nr:hypothetical protein [Patescibacteria group bacterium]